MGSTLDGKVAVVTGAANGIGRACALALAAEGASVVVADRDAVGVKDVADELDGSLALELDVSDVEACEAMSESVTEHFGSIDVVVTAAGIVNRDPCPALEMAPEEWRRIQEVNVLGTLFTIRACVPQLRVPASIVTIASGAGRRAHAGIGAYAVSKASVWMLTKVLALELGPAGIRVNCVGPGLIETPMTQHQLADPADRERAAAMVPLGRIGTPNDIASVVAFLAGDGARFVSGEIIGVDGGKDAAQRG